ncbi:MAG: hypothetical protein JWN78_943 [Bacteroidota bacterium]|nr:hypothetical protein [Bacteroidota bacterium]
MKPICTLLILILSLQHATAQPKKPTTPVTKTTKPATKTITKTKTKTKTITKTVKPAVKQEPQVLIIKIQSAEFKNMVGSFDIRQRIEDKIDDQLEATKNGEWISGDSGPGEANILYKVQNVDQATKLILKVLDEEKFIKSVIIGIRTSAPQGRWNYKVIYPTNYKGSI